VTAVVYYALSVLIVVGLAFFLGCSRVNTRGSDPDSASKPAVTQNAAEERGPVGAMCYKTMPAPRSTEACDYVCPKCGEKTHWAMDEVRADVDELAELRRLTKEITKIKIRLDESEFCGNCGHASSRPLARLLVWAHGTDSPPKTVRHITPYMLRALADYDNGRLAPLGVEPRSDMGSPEHREYTGRANQWQMVADFLDKPELMTPTTESTGTGDSDR